MKCNVAKDNNDTFHAGMRVSSTSRHCMQGHLESQEMSKGRGKRKMQQEKGQEILPKDLWLLLISDGVLTFILFC